MLRTLALALLALTLAVAVAACGGDDESAAPTTTEETTDGGGTTLAGSEIFVANCGSCHTLSDAGTSGSIGPELDDSGLSQEAIEEQVRNGGGGMPSFEGQLSDEEIAQVSEYVASN